MRPTKTGKEQRSSSLSDAAAQTDRAQGLGPIFKSLCVARRRQFLPAEMPCKSMNNYDAELCAYRDQKTKIIG